MSRVGDPWCRKPAETGDDSLRDVGEVRGALTQIAAQLLQRGAEFSEGLVDRELAGLAGLEWVCTASASEGS